MKYLLAILPFLAYSTTSAPSGMKIARCPDPRLVRCGTQADPICGYKEDGTYQTYTNFCMACVSEGGIRSYTQGSCPEASTTCVPNPLAACTMQYMPMCGTNNKGVRTTYSNKCAAKNDCATDVTEGACSQTTTTPITCVPNPNSPCTREFRQVCGTNTKGVRTTYSNPCIAKNDCATDIIEGACPELSPAPPSDQEPVVKKCVPERLLKCATVYDPVCGKDINGVETTFGSSCVAEMKCATDVTQGPCKGTTICTKKFTKTCNPRVATLVAVCGTKSDGTASLYSNECLACRDGAVTVASAPRGCKNAFDLS